MLLTTWPYWLAAGVIIIIGLAFYAGRLLMRVKQQQIQQQAAEDQRLKALNLHDTKVLNSIVIIVRAMKEQQCDLSEGCWRLSTLLGSLKTSAAPDQQFPAIFELYEKIKHMPILEQRKELPKKQRIKLDIERSKVEQDLTEQITKDLEQLHEFAIQRQNMLAP